jgi:hypothetical protein
MTRDPSRNPFLAWPISSPLVRRLAAATLVAAAGLIAGGAVGSAPAAPAPPGPFHDAGLAPLPTPGPRDAAPIPSDAPPPPVQPADAMPPRGLDAGARDAGPPQPPRDGGQAPARTRDAGAR